MKVVQMVRNRKPCDNAALKRLAIQLASQLPEDPDEALTVLEHCKTLVRTFLDEPGAS